MRFARWVLAAALAGLAGLKLFGLVALALGSTPVGAGIALRQLLYAAAFLWFAWRVRPPRRPDPSSDPGGG